MGQNIIPTQSLPDLSGVQDPVARLHLDLLYRKVIPLTEDFQKAWPTPASATDVVTKGYADATYGAKALSEALAARGSNPLRVDNLRGILADPQPFAGAVSCASWYQAADVAGLGFYTWDTDIYTSGIAVAQASDLEIFIQQEGRYLVLASLAARSAGSGIHEVNLQLEGDIIARAREDGVASVDRTSFLAAIIDCPLSSSLQAELVVGATRQGDANRRTQLTLIKLGNFGGA